MRLSPRSILAGIKKRIPRRGFPIGRRKTIGETAAGEDETGQPRLFGDGAPVDVEDVLLEMVRPAEVFAAEGAGEGIPGT